MKTYIYILICPLTKQVRYVGKSNDPKRRLKDHMIDFRNRQGEFAKTTWLLDLYTQNLKPDMEIAEEVDMSEWKEKEKYWIDYYKSMGCDLVNSKSGGNGLSVGNYQTFKKGNIPWNLGKKKVA